MPLKHTKLIFFLLLALLVAHAGADVAPGRIAVYSTISGSYACVDNNAQCDTTPTTFSVDGNAYHTVVVTQNGYQQWSSNVYVTTDQTSVVTADLQPNPSATGILVHVTPGSGTVCVDNSQCKTGVGDSSGTGSAQFTNLDGGYHTVTVRNTNGYLDYSTTAFVTMGEFTTVNINLDQVPSSTPTSTATGAVRVYINLAGSTVCIDNSNCIQNVGGAPGPADSTTLFNSVTANTVHTISVSAAGYLPYSTQVSVGQDQITTVDVTLQAGMVTTVPTIAGTTTSPATGTVRVYINLAGSTVCLDNTNCHQDVGGVTGPAAATTLFTDVPANAVHSVSVSAAGYLPYSTQVTVSQDQVNTVDVTLQPVQVTATPVTTTVIPTPLATQAGLGAVPVLGALVLCGALFLTRKQG